ncbi:hypothetical protein [Achromobacter sp. JUb104]|uniref:hypothetical protein n=1 Tax=Achromobacter sp. JUb104 TaxID=2940590 RepID=UPI002167A94E|nr:hypothetical protein [Achromobacter sp. JUb104]MCS3507371.1 hypothetical protein [Achromobacter sp. JUb104]
MQRSDFIELARWAAGDLKRFSYFVQLAENYGIHSDLLTVNVDAEKYEKIWFEMEIVNAVALSEWEIDGKPDEWGGRWVSEFQRDAVEVTENLIDFLEGLGRED